MKTLTREDGVTLIEVVIAMTIIVVVTTSVMALATTAVASAARARRDSMATLLAVERIEQLRGEGAGLATSPASSLAGNQPGHVDFLDPDGRWIGGGSAPPPGAGFVRRWRVSTLPGAGHAVVIEVVVASLANRSAVVDPFRPDDVRVVTMKGRKAW